MATYIAGPSVLWLTGASGSVQPGEAFEHDFSVDGPDGIHGPDRERALLACGAMTVQAAAIVAETPASPSADTSLLAQPSGARSTEE